MVIATTAAGFVWLFPVSELRIYAFSIALTFAAAAVFFIQRTSRRVHGQVSEARALRRLEKIITGGWALKRNVMLPLGDLDGLVTGPEGHAFALEIKSKASLKILRGSLWSKDKLVDTNGRSVGSKMLTQARNCAFQVDAQPVLWFPDAKEQGFSRDIEQVMVVLGPPRFLCRTLGIPVKTWVF